MIKRVAMFLLAVVAGYVTLVLLTVVVQEGMFGGVSYSKTPLPLILVAGVLTTACSAAGGAAAEVGCPTPEQATKQGLAINAESRLSPADVEAHYHS